MLQVDVALALAGPRLDAEARCADAAAAAAVRARFDAWRGERRCEPGDRVPSDAGMTWKDVEAAPSGTNIAYRAMSTWRRCLQAVVVRGECDRVTWTADLSGIGLADLVPLLRLPPRALVDNY